MKTEKNDTYKLIISLFIDQPSPRTEDYVKCPIHKPDDYTSNILTFTKSKKQL